MKVLILFLVIIYSQLSLGASYFLGPALSYRSSETEVSGVTSEATQTMLDLRIGGWWTQKVVIGGIYSSISTEGGGAQVNRTGVGPSLGYVSDTVMILASYLISTEHSNGSTVKKGTGFQVDLAYHFKLSSFSFGPMISYKTHNYTESTASGVTSEIEEKNTLIEPYFSAMFYF